MMEAQIGEKPDSEEKKREWQDIRTEYFRLVLAEDFQTASKYIRENFRHFGSEWRSKYRAPYFVKIDNKNKRVYLVYDWIWGEELNTIKKIEGWCEDDDSYVILIDFSVPLCQRLIREAYNAVAEEGCGDHAQDDLDGALRQVWDYEDFTRDEYNQMKFMRQGESLRLLIYQSKQHHR